jgi:hypothetical protein
VAGVYFACPFGITGVVAFSLQFTAEIEELDYVYAALSALSFKQAVCFWGAHGFG